MRTYPQYLTATLCLLFLEGLGKVNAILQFKFEIKKVKKNFVLLKFFLNFAKDSDSPSGLEGQISYWKRTLRTLSSTFEFSQNSSTRRCATGASTLGVLYAILHLCHCHRWCLLLQYHTTWAISSCLSLYEAMREAGMWDKREVEHPTSFLFPKLIC